MEGFLFFHIHIWVCVCGIAELSANHSECAGRVNLLELSKDFSFSAILCDFVSRSHSPLAIWLLAQLPGTIKFSHRATKMQWLPVQQPIRNDPLSEIKFSCILLFCSFDLLFGGKTLTTEQWSWVQSPLPPQRSRRNSAPEQLRSVLFKVYSWSYSFAWLQRKFWNVCRRSRWIHTHFFNQ